ncbi:MAG: hypothetical protein IJ341_02755 [Bacteroidales bacterium]|nr:hypothetical protein [Bacteroidales bacterium]
MGFPIITEKMQKEFAQKHSSDKNIYVPKICGVYGAACRVMNSPMGANKMICQHCSLANFKK